MREIKFRARHKTINQMFDWKEVIEYSNDQFQIVEDVNFFEDEELEFMQYTGMKDKNGKEIYEGDIVRYIGFTCVNHDDSGEVTYDGRKRHEKTFVNQIYFKDGGFKMRGGKWSGQLRERRKSRIEVIGNIYENLELLGTFKFDNKTWLKKTLNPKSK